MEKRANEISPQQVEKYIEDNAACVVVDVREDLEVAQGMIEQALHIPLELLSTSLDELDRSKEIICVCRSGSRSNTAT